MPNNPEQNREKCIKAKQTGIDLLRAGKLVYHSFKEYQTDFPGVGADWHADYVDQLKNRQIRFFKISDPEYRCSFPYGYISGVIVVWPGANCKVCLNDGDDWYLEKFFDDVADAEREMKNLETLVPLSIESLKYYGYKQG